MVKRARAKVAADTDPAAPSSTLLLRNSGQSLGRTTSPERSAPMRSVSGRPLSQYVISADQVRRGLPLSALDKLARDLNIDRTAFAQVLGTSLRTLQRKSGEGERLGPAASDRLARVTRILNLASHVFGTLEKASTWLTSKSAAFDDEIPLYMLDTDTGSERVQQELRQIEFGMPL